MMRLYVSLFMLLIAATLAVASCAPAVAPTSTAAAKPPAPTVLATGPTAAPAAPSKAAASPTVAPTAQPTAVPAKKTDYPAAGRTISLIVPYPAGGGTDIAARVVAPALEKELGVPVQVVNKGGAGAQLGTTEAAQAKPDGYTIEYMLFPTMITLYLDPERKAAFNRKSFVPIAMHGTDSIIFAVKADSPFRSLKDLIDAAKASPDAVKLSNNGLLGTDHLAIFLFQNLTGTKYAIVTFEGAAPGMTALLGGHTDAASTSLSPVLQQIKGAQLRALGVLDRGANQFLPGVKTFTEQGYPMVFDQSRGFLAPAGTPPEIVDILSRAIKKVIDTDEHRQKMLDLGQVVVYKDQTQFAAYWDELETMVKPLMDLAKQSK